MTRCIRSDRADEIYVNIADSIKTYLHHDRLGSVITQTDESGAILNRYTYGPFGESVGEFDIPFGYTGQRYDSEVDLYNYKARTYSPSIGRFLQPDPIGFRAGDTNLYAYVNNDVTNLCHVSLQLTASRCIPVHHPNRLGPGAQAESRRSAKVLKLLPNNNAKLTKFY